MSSASASPHGFTAVRGRGYRPDRVDARFGEMSLARDAAWERAARLTVLAREMGEELEGLRETVAGLAPQTYEGLGERARRLLALAEEEAEALREGARGAAREAREEAGAYADAVLGAAEADAAAVRTRADEWVRQRLLAARAEADALRITTRREAKAGRREALALVREARRRAGGTLSGQGREHAEALAGAERADARRIAGLDARRAELAEAAERELAAARHELAEAEAEAGRRDEEAGERAAELIGAATARARESARETERVLREHGELWDAVQAEMETVRARLQALSGRAEELAERHP
ncbi:cellulose-binding protein [Streptomyces sp. SID8352]|uniref:cellulose-binding protein n=1 Tax=Streptomyces sp. SID8352 TaxID=2690338 RepID=UPI00136CACC7|nr:cellulose-binding protein [Streptomyces sp. SID8352]MYU24916.1 cellulose-binding protein [Streptomyces sp. SID8352]